MLKKLKYKERFSTSMSPSKAHRDALWAQQINSIPTVSPQFPLNKYYDLNFRLSQYFSETISNKKWDDAYCLGKRFLTIALEVIPKHPYYKATAYDSRRQESRVESKRVEKQLLHCISMLDAEALEREELREARRIEQEVSEGGERAL